MTIGELEQPKVVDGDGQVRMNSAALTLAVPMKYTKVPSKYPPKYSGDSPDGIVSLAENEVVYGCKKKGVPKLTIPPKPCPERLKESPTAEREA